MLKIKEPWIRRHSTWLFSEGLATWLEAKLSTGNSIHPTRNAVMWSPQLPMKSLLQPGLVCVFLRSFLHCTYLCEHDNTNHIHLSLSIALWNKKSSFWPTNTLFAIFKDCTWFSTAIRGFSRSSLVVKGGQAGTTSCAPWQSKRWSPKTLQSEWVASVRKMKKT